MERDVLAKPFAAAVDAGQASAFEAWVRPHWQVMHRLAVRLVGTSGGEDVVQEALSTAWRKWAAFDPARGSPRSWLLALVADRARKWRRWHLRGARVLPAPDQSGPGPERAVDLERALARLTGRQKLAIDLYYYLDLPIRDVAAVMGCSGGTAKSTLADARRRLHIYLGDDPHA